MTKKFCLILAVITTASLSRVSAQQTVKVTASGIGYLEYLPQGYGSNNDKYPVVISLHGIKEKGTSSRDPKLVKPGVPKVANVGLPKYVRLGQKYSFILISPQLKSNMGTWSGDYVMEVINYVKKHLRIDDRRIYLTGLSLGGYGVWRVAGEYPNVFAAIVPVCSGGNSISKADAIAAANLPTWAFHGGNDRVVSHNVTTKMVNAINSAPKRPNPLAKATIFPGMSHIIWDKAYKQTSALDWMLGRRKGQSNNDEDKDEDKDDDENDDDKDEDEDKNSSPSVNAGSSRTITLPTNSISIQGSASDKDGSIKSYKWSKISGGEARLSGTTSSKMKAYNLKEGQYVFRLTVKDNKGASKSDQVNITVAKASKAEDKDKGEDKDKNSNKNNKRPVAIAGPDKLIKLPASSLSIQGRGADQDGSIVSYQWTKTYGGKVNMSGESNSTLRISNVERGAYFFKLTVKDNKGGTHSDVVKVTVRHDNRLPVVTGGPDRVLTLPNSSLSIPGTASDIDGKIVSYQWTKTYGGKATLSGTSGSTLRMSNLERGAYILRLTAKDNEGAVQHDYVKVTVKNR